MSRNKWSSLIPKPDWKEDVHYQEGNTQDIINVLISAYKYNNFQASREMKNVAAELQDKSVYKTLRNVWAFVKDNIQYKVDEPGYEKIKSPALLFHYGIGDCKSFSLMIAGILSNYKDVGFSFRFTSYEKNKDFGHVYIVADIPGQKRKIILDSTIDAFDKEEPFVKKIDYSMTQISHLHGVPNIRTTKARPSVAQAFINGPRVVVSPKIDITKFTQGQLTIELLKANLTIQQNYYGDPVGEISKGLMILDQAQVDLPNFKVLGAIDPVYNGLISQILNAQKRHINQIEVVSQLKDSVGISGAFKWNGLMNEQELLDCVKKTNPDIAGDFYRNFLNNTWVEVGGHRYQYTKGLATCMSQIQQLEWARNNIFQAPNFIKGSHSLLYDFNNDQYKGLMNSAGITKTVLHATHVDAFANISGLDRINVRLYVKNGIAQTSGSNKIDINPEYSIKALSEGLQYKGQPGIGIIDPVTVSIVIGIISTAIKGMSDVVKTLIESKRQVLVSQAQGLGSESAKASINDFDKKISSAESLNTIVPIVLGGAALAYFAFTKSKK